MLLEQVSAKNGGRKAPHVSFQAMLHVYFLKLA